MNKKRDPLDDASGHMDQRLQVWDRLDGTGGCTRNCNCTYSCGTEHVGSMYMSTSKCVHVSAAARVQHSSFNAQAVPLRTRAVAVGFCPVR